MTDLYQQACEALIKKFADDHNLDLELDYEWPPELIDEMGRLARELQIAFGRKPL